MTENYQLVYYDAENVRFIGILPYPKMLSMITINVKILLKVDTLTNTFIFTIIFREQYITSRFQIAIDVKTIIIGHVFIQTFFLCGWEQNFFKITIMTNYNRFHVIIAI